MIQENYNSVIFSLSLYSSIFTLFLLIRMIKHDTIDDKKESLNFFIATGISCALWGHFYYL